MDENFLMTDMVIFDAKPDAVPYRYRISYKIDIKYLWRIKLFISKITNDFECIK